MDDLISCIISTYNRAHLLAIAVDSVLNQTYQNWELLIVDDQSTDDTPRLVREYQKADPRIKYLRNTGKGLPSARNFGIRAAKGEYIAFLDDDDISLPHRFESQLKAMQSSGRGFLVSGYKVKKFQTGEIVSEHKLELTAFGAGFPSRWMVKKSLLEKIGGFDESFASMEDTECSYRLAEHEIFALHDDIVLIYVIHPQSMSRDPSANLEGRLKLLEKHGRSMHPVEAAWWYYTAGMDFYQLSGRKKALLYLKKAAELDERGVYRWGYLYFRWASYLKGIFKKVNLKVLNMLDEKSTFPTLVHHPVV